MIHLTTQAHQLQQSKNLSEPHVLLAYNTLWLKQDPITLISMIGCNRISDQALAAKLITWKVRATPEITKALTACRETDKIASLLISYKPEWEAMWRDNEGNGVKGAKANYDLLRQLIEDKEISLGRLAELFVSFKLSEALKDSFGKEYGRLIDADISAWRGAPSVEKFLKENFPLLTFQSLWNLHIDLSKSNPELGLDNNIELLCLMIANSQCSDQKISKDQISEKDLVEFLNIQKIGNNGGIGTSNRVLEALWNLKKVESLDSFRRFAEYNDRWSSCQTSNDIRDLLISIISNTTQVTHQELGEFVNRKAIHHDSDLVNSTAVTNALKEFRKLNSLNSLIRLGFYCRKWNENAQLGILQPGQGFRLNVALLSQLVSSDLDDQDLVAFIEIKSIRSNGAFGSHSDVLAALKTRESSSLQSFIEKTKKISSATTQSPKEQLLQKIKSNIDDSTLKQFLTENNIDSSSALSKDLDVIRALFAHRNCKSITEFNMKK